MNNHSYAINWSIINSLWLKINACIEYKLLLPAKLLIPINLHICMAWSFLSYNSYSPVVKHQVTEHSFQNVSLEFGIISVCLGFILIIIIIPYLMTLCIYYLSISPQCINTMRAQTPDPFSVLVTRPSPLLSMSLSTYVNLHNATWISKNKCTFFHPYFKSDDYSKTMSVLNCIKSIIDICLSHLTLMCKKVTIYSLYVVGLYGFCVTFLYFFFYVCTLCTILILINKYDAECLSVHQKSAQNHVNELLSSTRAWML